MSFHEMQMCVKSEYKLTTARVTSQYLTTPDKMELDKRKDIVGELYMRGLHTLVERILANTDARTVAACHQVLNL